MMSNVSKMRRVAAGLFLLSLFLLPRGRLNADKDVASVIARRHYWAFQKPVKSAVPDIKAQSPWVRNPVDAFILEALQEKKLTPSPPLDREHLLRRVTFDLTGLATGAGRNRRLSPRQESGRLRESGGPPARLAALWRALGAALARCGPLCRYQRLRAGRRAAAGVALPRLRRPGFQLPTNRTIASSRSRSPAMSCIRRITKR